MSRVRLLLQKRPGFGPVGWLAHIITVLVLSWHYKRWCKYSHAELEIGSMHYSATTDKGPRAARLVIDPNEWDVHECERVDKQAAVTRFLAIEGRGYDFLGAAWWGLDVAKQRPTRWTCFETIAEMLGMPDPHKVGPFELIDWLEQLDTENSL
jgi:hypothetical protein